MPMPSRRACAGPASSILSPCQRSSPALGWISPYMTLTSVDLPAPFSPSSAWILCGMRSRLMASFAKSSPKRLLISIAWSSGCGAGAVTCVWWWIADDVPP
jgi:hypothetical protein